MAKTIAKVGGVALAPGVSRNKRWYKPEHVAGMVARVQSKIESGNSPVLRERDEAVTDHVVSQRTHHAAEDDSTRIVGRVTSMTLDESGRARFTAEIADTPAGRTIANLLDTTDGNPPFLRGVSGRMAWLSGARIVAGPNGEPVETGDLTALDLMGLDYTHKPGVTDANVDTFEWTNGGQRTETDQRVLIYESDLEAHVVPITEAITRSGEQSCADLDHTCCKATTATETAVLTAFRAIVPEPPHDLANGLCVTCPAPVVDESATPMGKRSSGIQGTGGPYADPGYQADKKQRYQLDTKAHAKAAWSYISQAKNAKLYTSAQLKRVKQRILAALKKFGVKAASEGWVIEPAVLVTEALNECYASDCPAGSYCLTASNGPTNITISGYRVEPADLDVIIQAAADAACMALQRLDPDMDGDIDVPGADAEDKDGDAGDVPAVPSMTLTGQESTEDDPAETGTTDDADPAESDTTPAPVAAAGETETEGTPLAPTTEAQTAAGTSTAATFTQAQLDAAVAAGIAAADKARRERKAAKRSQPAETSGAAPVTETTAPAAAATSQPVSETLDQIVARKVAEKVAADYPQESEEQRIERMVSEAYDAQVAKMVQTGQIDVSRRGVVRPANETATAGAAGGVNGHGLPSGFPDKPMHQYNSDEFNDFASALTAEYVLGHQRAQRIVPPTT